MATAVVATRFAKVRAGPIARRSHTNNLDCSFPHVIFPVRLQSPGILPCLLISSPACPPSRYTPSTPHDRTASRPPRPALSRPFRRPRRRRRQPTLSDNGPACSASAWPEVVVVWHRRRAEGIPVADLREMDEALWYASNKPAFALMLMDALYRRCHIHPRIWQPGNCPQHRRGSQRPLREA